MADAFGLIDIKGEVILYESLGRLNEFWKVMERKFSKIEDENKKKDALNWLKN